MFVVGIGRLLGESIIGWLLLRMVIMVDVLLRMVLIGLFRFIWKVLFSFMVVLLWIWILIDIVVVLVGKIRMLFMVV